MSLESLFISSVSAVVLPVPHLVLLHALGGLHVIGFAGYEASLNIIKVSVHIPLIEVALLVACFCKVLSSPCALGTLPSAVAVLPSLSSARVVAAPFLVLAAKDLVAALALSVPTNASITTPPGTN